MEMLSSPRVFNRLLYNHLGTLAVNFGGKARDQTYGFEDARPNDWFHPDTISRFADDSEDNADTAMQVIDYRVPQYDAALTRVRLFGVTRYPQSAFRSRFTFAFSVCESDTEGLTLVHEQSIVPNVHGQRLVFPEDEGAALVRTLARWSHELYLMD